MKKEHMFKYIFLLFIILQPFLDCYLLYSNKVISALGFSPTTIIRMVVILIYVCIIYITCRRGRKLFTIYSLILLLYFIIHHVVSVSIDDHLIYESLNYSLIEEIFYFIRMFLPICVIYILYNLKITKEEFREVIKYTTIGVVGIIIILNILGIARTSYGSVQISGNIFEWFNNNYLKTQLASKGWFNSANQVGGLVLLLIVVNNYFTLDNPNKSNLIIQSLLILSSMMIGTRVTTIIICYLSVAMFISYFVVCKLQKRKPQKKSIIFSVIIIVVTLSIYGIAPIVNCDKNNYMCLFELNNGLDSSNRIKYDSNLKYDNKNICLFLEKTPTNKEYYKTIYPCSDNINFWSKYAKKQIYKYANNRTLELLVTKDVYSKIKTPLINLFGMSRSRFLNAKFYLEKDVYVHYYTMGIIGIILFILVPYFSPVVLYLIKCIKDKKIEGFSLTLCMSIMILVLVSYMSGHILDELIVTMYLGLICATLLSRIYQSKEKDISDRILIVNDERMMGGVSILLEDILNNISNKYKIDLLILHNHGTRLSDLPSSVNLIYGTNFFDVVDLNIKELLKQKNVYLILKKIYLVFLIKTRLIKWRIREERERILKYRYCKEIAFKEGFCGLFTAYGDSKNKIQWLHSDYSKSDFSSKYRDQFLNIYNRFDTFIAVSSGVKNSFNKIYGQDDKTIVINNLVDENKIKDLSKEEKIVYKEKINLISVGRLQIDKCFDKMIRIIDKLVNIDNITNIKYRIIGDGYEYDNLYNMIKDRKLEKYVELLGRKENPYPYVVSSDLFVMSSRHESFGLVVVESLILGVPVIATHIVAINELLDKAYGQIVDNNEDALYNGIKEILKKNDKIKTWKKNLKGYKYNNNDIIKKIDDILKK